MSVINSDNEKQHRAEIRKMMRTPKQIKASLTIIGFSLIDLLAVGGGALVGLKLSANINVSFSLKVLILLSFPFFALLLVMRTPLQPKVRNWRVVISCLKEDRKKYYPLLVERKPKNVWD